MKKLTEIGTVMLAVGGSLVAGAKVAPVVEGLSEWLTFVGTLLMSLGTALLGYRVSKKISESNVNAPSIK